MFLFYEYDIFWVFLIIVSFIFILVFWILVFLVLVCEGLEKFFSYELGIEFMGGVWL